jgi:hypothetical protein
MWKFSGRSVYQGIAEIRTVRIEAADINSVLSRLSSLALDE